MTKKFNDKHLEKLLSKERLEMLRIHDVIEAAEIQGDMNVLDVGAGAGAFTFPVAKVITGQVFALDTSEKMIHFMNQQIAEKACHNVETIHGTVEMVNNRHFERILLIHLFHEVDDRESFVASLNRLMTSDGLIVLLDFKKLEEDFGPSFEHRISEDEAVKIMSPYFEEIKRYDWGPSLYLSLYKKKR